MTELHAGGKFDNNSYKICRRLHGVGVSVVNALSDWLRSPYRRDGQSHFMEFKGGVAVGPLKVTGKTERRGTEVHFLASAATSASSSTISTSWPSGCASCLSSTTAVKIQLVDQRSGKDENFAPHRRGEGLRRVHQQEQERAAHDAVSRGSPRRTASRWKSRCSGTTPTRSRYCASRNNIPQRDGGTHLSGLRAAMTRSLNQYIESNENRQEGQGRNQRRRHARGPSCVLSIKVPEPKFSSQTKDSWSSSEVGPVVQEWSGRS